MFKLARANAKALRYLRAGFACPSCEAKRTLPGARRATAVPRCYRFSQVVGTDLLQRLNMVTGEPQEYHRVVCWGARALVVRPSKQVWDHPRFRR